MAKRAVGQIASICLETGTAERGSSFRIRLLSSIGLYPRGHIQGFRGIYFIDDHLAYIAVRTNEQRKHAYWSELTLFAFEEIRFLSAVLLSMRPDRGVLRLYPGGAHITDSDPKAFYEKAKYLALKTTDERRTVSIPLTGGPPYEISQQSIDITLFKKLMAKISIDDHLMLRGLSALLKADMLLAHKEFAEEAITILYVAMEVAFQLTLRLLRDSGISTPSAFDAGQFMHSTFPNEVPGKRFFEDYYEDRIKTLHPHSRGGTFAFPPVTASDTYGLRAGLIATFQYLIADEKWYTLWD